LQELSILIRPDTAAIVQTSSSMTFHNAGVIKWLVVQDSSQSKMWVFDQDLGQWNVPWGIAGTAIHSGEVAAGSVKLFLSLKGSTVSRIVTLDPTTYSDLKNTSGDTFAASTYTANVKSALSNIIPASNEMPRDGMGAWGSLEYIGFERNSVEISTVAFALDDDPTAAATVYNDISINRQDPSRRTQGLTLFEDIYYARKPSGRRMCFSLAWDAAATEFKIHTLDIASEMGTMQGEY